MYFMREISMPEPLLIITNLVPKQSQIIQNIDIQTITIIIVRSIDKITLSFWKGYFHFGTSII